MKLHRDLGVTRKAARRIAHRIRESWAEINETFGGTAEADDACMDGWERNKHESRKLRAGRGAVGKTPVAGVNERETNQASLEVDERTDKSNACAA